METQIPLLNWTQILQQFGYSVEYLSSINFSETNPQRAQLFIVGEDRRSALTPALLLERERDADYRNHAHRPPRSAALQTRRKRSCHPGRWPRPLFLGGEQR